MNAKHVIRCLILGREIAFYQRIEIYRLNLLSSLDGLKKKEREREIKIEKKKPICSAAKASFIRSAIKYFSNANIFNRTIQHNTINTNVSE